MRERTRAAIRDQLADTALTLFVARGFDRVTIDDLVAATGVSRRSFFRYFASKEDIVLGFMTDLAESLVHALAERPADEGVWESLRRACDPAVARYAHDAERMLALFGLFEQTPSLRARHAEKHLHCHAGLTGELAGRLGVDPAEDLRPAVWAGSALAALQAALDAWAAHPQRPIEALLDEAFAALPRAA
ncbi:TetR family transcriptional regulator [Cryptosporangium minutisporangium]|uniref:TetR family transcriptional regulator n=1 Tax=Cryptosporangium minutisporangium TaxID=113569 RepID=A0ABP6SQW3_9ACTN